VFLLNGDAKLIFEFPPFINRGSTGTQFFWDAKGTKVGKIIFLDSAAFKVFFALIVEHNQTNLYNTIIFETKKDGYERASISISFNQQVEDKFRNNLPKSKRGKTIPWWKNEEETKGI
jgi:hypothetical protein